MAEQLNLNNLELDDNEFKLLPDGDYHFTVDSHEVGFSTSKKMPPNTQQITCYLEIPYFDEDGDLKYATVRNNLNIYKKALFAIRQFVECIGLAPEKGKANVDLAKMDGLAGICSITTNESNGREYNNVQTFYAPSKAPVVTLNDEAWLKKDDFMEVPDDIPFDDGI